MEPGNLSPAVHDAMRRPEVRAAAAELYASIGREIAQRRPICEMSGKCCHFDQYGHRLFVTTIELAAFLHDYQQRPVKQIAAHDGKGCPFQIGKMCGVHSIRPFGCRIFFCDPTSTEWQNQQYEIHHTKLKSLHESLNVPYAYVEWRSALEQLGIK